MPKRAKKLLALMLVEIHVAEPTSDASAPWRSRHRLQTRDEANCPLRLGATAHGEHWTVDLVDADANDGIGKRLRQRSSRRLGAGERRQDHRARARGAPLHQPPARAASRSYGHDSGRAEYDRP